MEWINPCQVQRVVDGDTIEIAVIDAGYGLRLATSRQFPLMLRITGCDAYDRAAGPLLFQAAKDFTTEWVAASLPMPFPFWIRTIGRDNFGRWLGRIWREGDDPEHDLTWMLLDRGLAVPRG